MRLLTQDALAALDAGRFALRTLLLVDMPDGPEGFWDDCYDVTVEGQLYRACNGGFHISGLHSSADMGVRALNLTVSGLAPEISSRVLAEPWHQRAVTLSLAILTIDPTQIVAVEPWFTGFLDTVDEIETVGGDYSIVFRCEGIGRELNRSGARTRSDSDQRQIDANDGFFKHVVAAGTVSLQWGRVTPPTPPKQKRPGGLAGLLDKIF